MFYFNLPMILWLLKRLGNFSIASVVAKSNSMSCGVRSLKFKSWICHLLDNILEMLHNFSGVFSCFVKSKSVWHLCHINILNFKSNILCKELGIALRTYGWSVVINNSSCIFSCKWSICAFCLSAFVTENVTLMIARSQGCKQRFSSVLSNTITTHYIGQVK